MIQFYPKTIADIRSSTDEGNVIMPGSFNPLHFGHRNIIKHAREYTKKPVFLEHCVNSLDKPDSYARIADVVAQAWNADCSIYITDANMFVYKAELFKKPIFAIGADTFGRIIDPKYRDGSVQAIRNDLRYMYDRGVEFLVYPRLIGGVTITMKDYDIVAERNGFDLYNFTDISEPFIQERYPFTPISVSSTQLRKQKDFEYGEPVVYTPDGTRYEFGYYSASDGLAVVYEPGERNMQDSVVVKIDKLERARA